jgi:hypothetical protein
MKKISFLIVVMQLALSINSNAQLNYLFSPTTRPYVPVTGGITPHLIKSPFDYPPPSRTVEDEGFATIPIGFTFNYDYKNYTHVNVSVNGFITLGDSFSTRITGNLYRNSLAMGPFAFNGEKTSYCCSLG